MQNVIVLQQSLEFTSLHDAGSEGEYEEYDNQEDSLEDSLEDDVSSISSMEASLPLQGRHQRFFRRSEFNECSSSDDEAIMGTAVAPNSITSMIPQQVSSVNPGFVISHRLQIKRQRAKIRKRKRGK